MTERSNHVISSALLLLFFLASIAVITSPRIQDNHGLMLATAFQFPHPPQTNNNRFSMKLFAKRRKREQEDKDIDMFNQWYERVDKDASPDDVFWDEMERQRAMKRESSPLESSADRDRDRDRDRDIASLLPYVSASPSSSGSSISGSAASSSGSGGGGVLVGGGAVSTAATAFAAPSSFGARKATAAVSQNPEALLQSFAYAAVKNNFLGDDYFDWDSGSSPDDVYDDGAGEPMEEDEEMELQRKALDQQLDELLSFPEDELRRYDDDEIWDMWAAKDDEYQQEDQLIDQDG